MNVINRDRCWLKWNCGQREDIEDPTGEGRKIRREDDGRGEEKLSVLRGGKHDATFTTGSVRADSRGRETLEVHQVPATFVEVLQMRFFPRVVGLVGRALLRDRRVRFRSPRSKP